MTTLHARFTLTYNLVVLAVTAVLSLWTWYLIGGLHAGWTWTNGTLTITEATLKLIVMIPLMLAAFATQFLELFRPRPVLILTPSGLHDRRLTRGPLLWSQIDHILIYRKGWQQVAVITPKSLTTPSHDMDLGPMPLYAFNRLCARWLKRPELVVGLGGMSVPTADLLTYITQHLKPDRFSQQ